MKIKVHEVLKLNLFTTTPAAYYKFHNTCYYKVLHWVHELQHKHVFDIPSTIEGIYTILLLTDRHADKPLMVIQSFKQW